MVKQYYQADDSKRVNKRHTPGVAKDRKNLVPGQVLVLLTGRFRGKRVVFLKQLPSGLLLVTGPYKVNGVPLKRVNSVYTITTSTKVDVSGVDVKSVDDATFKKEAKNTSKKSQKFFAEEAPKTSVSAARKDLQKKVDTAILSKLKDGMVKKYLNARFSLTKNDAPHEMKF